MKNLLLIIFLLVSFKSISQYNNPFNNTSNKTNYKIYIIGEWTWVFNENTQETCGLEQGQQIIFIDYYNHKKAIYKAYCKDNTGTPCSGEVIFLADIDFGKTQNDLYRKNTLYKFNKKRRLDSILNKYN